MLKQLTVTLLLIVVLTINIAQAVKLSAAEKKQIVDTHNFLRTKVYPAAASMQTIVWDTKLEKIAADWASQCKSDSGILLGHNPNRSKTYSTYVGENIYASSSTTSANVVSAVNMWFNEAKYFNYSTNKCQAGQVCGHYTQVVWAKTNKIGCARNYCKNVRFGMSIVCNYAPGGNFNNELPYVKGKANGQTGIYTAK